MLMILNFTADVDVDDDIAVFVSNKVIMIKLDFHISPRRESHYLSALHGILISMSWKIPYVMHLVRSQIQSYLSHPYKVHIWNEYMSMIWVLFLSLRWRVVIHLCLERLRAVHVNHVPYAPSWRTALSSGYGIWYIRPDLSESHNRWFFYSKIVLLALVRQLQMAEWEVSHVRCQIRGCGKTTVFTFCKQRGGV